MQLNEIGLLIIIALGGVTICWIFFGDHPERGMKIKKFREEIKNDIENL